MVATVCAVGISATVGDCGTAGGKTARAGSAVGDTLIGRTQAAAVVYIVRKKQHQHLKTASSFLPNGTVAVSATDSELPELTAVRKSIDLESVGIAGVLPRLA